MAIKIVFGPGGAGKSIYQMVMIVLRVLRETNKNISTNLAIDVPKLNAYLEREFPEERLNLLSRLRILTDAETYEFWKYRGPLKWSTSPKFEYDMEEDQGVNGCVFIIDEAGVSGFSATGWAQKQGQGTRGERCLWYLDQQRKFGDDVYASTNGRTPEQIAKPFRDKAHGFIKLKNGYLQKFGPFKGRGRFEWSEFVEEPRKTSEPIAQGHFELSEIANCYRTQDGVGVKGNAADKGQRAKGIPVLWVIPGALVLAALCVLIPYGLGKGASKFIAGSAPDPQGTSAANLSDSTSEKKAGTTLTATPRAAQDGRQINPAPLEPVYSDDTPERPLWVSGWVIKGDKINLQLSDGRILTEKDPEVAKLERNAIHLKTGQRLFIQGKRPLTMPAVDTTVNAPQPGSVVVAGDVAASPSWVRGEDGVARLTESAAASTRIMVK